MVIEESGLRFQFADIFKAIKFDDTDFYVKEFCKLPSGKGVDILADSKDMIQFIEIKNCKGHEQDNLWRTGVNNSKIKSAPHDLEVDARDSLDIEMAKKVSSTIACLTGAWTKSGRMDKAKELAEFKDGLYDNKLLNDKKKLLIILFLEGDFYPDQIRSRTKKMMMSRIQDSINAKLQWLNCRVSVVDSKTYNHSCFKII